MVPVVVFLVPFCDDSSSCVPSPCRAAQQQPTLNVSKSLAASAVSFAWLSGNDNETHVDCSEPMTSDEGSVPSVAARQEDRLQQVLDASAPTILTSPSRSRDSKMVMSWLSCEQAALAPVREVLDMLRVDGRQGLDTEEADRRRVIHGFNEVGVKVQEPLWKKYLEQFQNPFILLLLVSAFISICMREFDNAVSITVAIVIVVTVGFVQEYRSEKTLERMGSLLPPSCRCVRDRSEEPDVLFARYLVPGDIVHLQLGDRVPADLRLVEVSELAIDESSFTGETEPKYKTADAIERRIKISCGDMANVGFQGTLVIHGSGVGVVICTGERSQFGEVFRLMQSEEPPRTPLQKSMDTLGKQLSVYSLAVIGLIMVVGWLQGRPILEMFNVGVSLAVAAIPEGLPIVVTVTLALGVMRMARRNAVVKRLPTVEALGCVDWICSDKTGTLTSNEMTLAGVLTPAEILDYSLSRNKNLVASVTLRMDCNATANVMEAAVLCNNAIRSHHDGLVGSPTEKALLVAASKMGIEDSIKATHVRVQEIPFSSERKFMAVKCQARGGESVACYVKGAVEVLSELCKSVSTNGYAEPMSEQWKLRINEASTALGRGGQRVLALARGPDMEHLEFLGLATLLDPPRAGVRESVTSLLRSKVNVCMVTGDGRETAAAIASMIGMADSGSILLSGAEIDKLSDRELEVAAEKCYCYYRTSPYHKLRIVKALQAKGHVVAMTGDGVNDGVAIKKADVGIAMGITGTDVCKEASDMILLDDDFSTILSAIEEGKCIFYNIRNFVRFQLSTSIAALMLISLSTLFDIPNPLNAMQILWINVIMDGPPAQSLGLEPVDHEVLKRPPRKKEQILSRALLLNVLLSASVIIAGTLWVFKETLEDGHMTARETTMTFTCFVFFDMFNALTCRSQERLVAEIGFFSNRMFCVAVTLSILGQLAVIYLPPLQYVFQTEALSAGDLFLLVGLSSTVFVVSEGKKFLERYSLGDIKRLVTTGRMQSGMAYLAKEDSHHAI
jgi:Ca2+-transporting ATPase